MSVLERLQEQAEKIAESKSSGNGEGGMDGLVSSIQIPIEIPFKGGKARVYVSVPGDIIDDPNVLMAVMNELDSIANGVAIFRPKKDWNNNPFSSKKK